MCMCKQWVACHAVDTSNTVMHALFVQNISLCRDACKIDGCAYLSLQARMVAFCHTKSCALGFLPFPACAAVVLRVSGHFAIQSGPDHIKFLPAAPG